MTYAKEIREAAAAQDKFMRRQSLRREFQAVWWDLPKRWELLKLVYEEYMPDIQEAGSRGRGIDPYFVDWVTMFSKIEDAAWFSIRSKGICFYPQMPILDYFVDFVNPWLKIGVELDGEKYHNRAADIERDTRLVKHGWKIFRVPGRECFGDVNCDALDSDIERERESAASDWLISTVDGVFESIKIQYFDRTNPEIHPYYRYVTESLKQHQLIEFSL